MIRASALPRVVEWRLHLGAHKTATTHLQQTLEALRPHLRKRDVDVLSTEAVRDIWAGQMRRHRVYRHLHKWPIARGLPLPVRDSAHFASGLANLQTGASTAVLSEENIIGETDAAITDRLYPAMTVRLTVLRTLIGRRTPVRLFLGIRDMSDFLPSVYAEALRFFPVDGTFETVMARALDRPPRWSCLVSDLRKAWPGAQLTVWRYEDYQPHTREIVTRVAGTDPGPLPDIPRPPQTMIPSAATVRAVEADREALAALDYTTRCRAVEEIYASAPASPAAPAFRPMTEAQATRCRTAYEADCAALDRAGVLFSP